MHLGLRFSPRLSLLWNADAVIPALALRVVAVLSPAATLDRSEPCTYPI